MPSDRADSGEAPEAANAASSANDPTANEAGGYTIDFGSAFTMANQSVPTTGYTTENGFTTGFGKGFASGYSPKGAKEGTITSAGFGKETANTASVDYGALSFSFTDNPFKGTQTYDVTIKDSSYTVNFNGTVGAPAATATVGLSLKDGPTTLDVTASKTIGTKDQPTLGLSVTYNAKDEKYGFSVVVDKDQSINLTGKYESDVISINGNYNPSTKGWGANLSLKFPVFIDFDNDGIEAIPLQNGISIESNDGTFVKSSWIGPKDGVLLYDYTISLYTEYLKFDYLDFTKYARSKEDGNGEQKAVHGSDLDGLKAEFDSNRDGKIDKNDIAFNRLSVFVDRDSDGEIDPGEVQNLTEAGLLSVDVSTVGPEFFDLNKATVSVETGSVLRTTTAEMQSGKSISIADAALVAITIGSDIPRRSDGGISSKDERASVERAYSYWLENRGRLQSLIATDNSGKLKSALETLLQRAAFYRLDHTLQVGVRELQARAASWTTAKLVSANGLATVDLAGC